jgi:hypothetical protein
MIGELADDLERDGVILVIARDVGQVRDVLRRADPGHAPVHAFPTVQDAVDAVSSPGGLPSPPPAPVAAPHPAG